MAILVDKYRVPIETAAVTLPSVVQCIRVPRDEVQSDWIATRRNYQVEPHLTSLAIT